MRDATIYAVLATVFAGGISNIEPAKALAQECPNEQLRVEDRSNRLPDCRAYEQVSPVEKNGGDVNNPIFQGSRWLPGEISVSGDRAVYLSTTGFTETQASITQSAYLAERIPGGWSTEGITPPLGPGNLGLTESTQLYSAFTPELSTGVVETFGPELTPTAPPAFANLYLRENVDGDYQLLTTITPPNRSSGANGNQYNLEGPFGASIDLSHVIFGANDALTQNVSDPGETGEMLYEAVGGQVVPISVLPNGEAAPQDATSNEVGLGAGVSGVEIAPASPQLHGISPANVGIHFVSADGSRVFWTDVAKGGQLYVRENGTTTVPIPGGSFAAASVDGSKVFVINEGVLSEYDLNTEQLTPLTGSVGVNHVVGLGEDGSYVYYTASEGLLLWHEGTTALIHALASASAVSQADAAVTPDGGHLAFASTESLTGYNNTPANSSTVCDTAAKKTHDRPCPEIYLYTAPSEAHPEGMLACPSCNPSGAPPVGWSSMQPAGGHDLDLNLPRYLSNNGERLFFDSTDAILSQDVNGAQDVYEWEQGGIGSCRSSSTSFNASSGGCLYLISSGTDSGESWFIDATPSGDGVIFTTRAGLVGQDTDDNVDLYDARVEGGFPFTPAPQPCGGETCKPLPSTQPAFATPTSAMFSGVGNLPPVAEVKHVKPVKKKAKPKKRKKKKKRHDGKKASKSARARRIHMRGHRS